MRVQIGRPSAVSPLTLRPPRMVVMVETQERLLSKLVEGLWILSPTDTMSSTLRHSRHERINSTFQLDAIPPARIRTPLGDT